MDVIKPNFVTNDNKCFRSFYSQAKTWVGNSDEAEESYCQDFEDQDEPLPDESEPIVIAKDSDSSYSHSIVIPPEFNGIIIGTRGENLFKLERTTKCRILIPKRNQHKLSSEAVTIKSSSEQNIYSARRKLLAIIDRARSRMQPNYFIHIPVCDDQISERYNQLRNMILRDRDKEPSKFVGICEELFQDPKRFHLTICMLLILDCYDELGKAINILEKLEEKKIRPLLRGKIISVELQGLEYMNDDITAVDVLYAKIHPNDPMLQQICDLIEEEFKNTNFIARERAKVVLHLTLLNSKFKLRKSIKAGPWHSSNKDLRPKFDATEIMNKYGDYYFGETNLERIELSFMYPGASDGSSEPAHIINLL